MRWTTPQPPCCNPARLVLQAAYVDHVERGPGPRPPSGMLARTCHPLASPGRARRLVLDKACPSFIPVAALIDAAAVTHPAKPWSLAVLPHRHVSDFQRRLELRQHLIFFLGCPPARFVF